MTIWVVSRNPAYLVAVSAGHVENLPTAIVIVLYVAFSLAFVCFFIIDTPKLIKLGRGVRFVRCADPVVKVKPPTDAVTTYSTDGNKPPPSIFHIIATKQPYSIKSFDDGSCLNENRFGTSGYYTAYSDYLQKSRIIGGGNVKPTLIRSTSHEAECLADKDCSHTIEKSHEPSLQDDYRDNQAPHTNYNFSSLKGTHALGIRKESSLTYTVKQKEMSQKQVYRNLETQNSTNEHSKKQTVRNKLVNPPQEKLPGSLQEPRLFTGYNKPTYAVLIGNSVKVYNTSTYALLPHSNKFLVKERHRDTSGITRVRLTLKLTENDESSNVLKCLPDEDVEKDGANTYDEKVHYRENIKCIGHVIYTCDVNFRGDIKYPLPSKKATNSKIGRGRNGFVFIIYHGKKQYAVKQTIYRSNEVNVHSALSHENVLPLLAVLMGEKHETHSGRLYCYHFMPKMDYDLRQILSMKEFGCLKYLYRKSLTDQAKFDRGFNNVKFILKETLKALSYIHSSGFVHRDVKASNIMIRMNCKCNPLYCDCVSKFRVRLGDFDSAGTIPGLEMKEPTDQMIKFASILPLGTPGYQAPEVSQHIVLSGPYEILYTTAVDMWSFGCLFLNICIGKTVALKQREEALLLLSTHKCFEELWIKTSKIQELERTQPFSHDTKLLYLIRSCLRVDYNKRLLATEAQTYL